MRAAMYGHGRPTRKGRSPHAKPLYRRRARPRMILVSDVPAGRIRGRRPDAVFEVMAKAQGHGPPASVRGRAVMSVRLCEYVERTGGERGPYSLITAVVETDRGAAEMLYDEGYRGRSALADAGRFLVMHLGASALVERAVAAIESRKRVGGGKRGGGASGGGRRGGSPPARPRRPKMRGPASRWRPAAQSPPGGAARARKGRRGPGRGGQDSPSPPPPSSAGQTVNSAAPRPALCGQGTSS